MATRKGVSPSRSHDASSSKNKSRRNTHKLRNSSNLINNFDTKKKGTALVKKKIEDLKTPDLIIKANYKNKKLSIPMSLLGGQNLHHIITPHIVRFEREILKNPDFSPSSIECWKTIAPGDVLKDYYFQSGRPLDLMKGQILQIEPVWSQARSSRVSIEDFEVIRCIGTGGFSRVFLARLMGSGKFYALKLMDKQGVIESGRDCVVENERNIMKELDSPHVVKLEFAFETKHYFALALEYCPGGELFHYLRKVKRMSEEEARYCFIEILLGLEHLHKKKIIYRDIKPENIMIDANGNLKIADFGLSKKIKGNQDLAHTYCGSPQYMAPEMLSREGHSFPVDYYCLGALLYEMVTGSPPFYCQDFQKIAYAIEHEEIDFPPCFNLSSEIKMLLKGLLEKEPNRRLGSLGGIKEILGHPWVRKMKVADILSKKVSTPISVDLMTFNMNEEEISALDDSFFSLLKQESDHFQEFFDDFYYTRDDKYEGLGQSDSKLQKGQQKNHLKNIGHKNSKSKEKGLKEYKSHNREHPSYPISIKNKENEVGGMTQVRGYQNQRNGPRKKLDLVTKGRKRNDRSMEKSEKRLKQKSRIQMVSPTLQPRPKSGLKRMKSSGALHSKKI